MSGDQTAVPRVWTVYPNGRWVAHSGGPLGTPKRIERAEQVVPLADYQRLQETIESVARDLRDIVAAWEHKNLLAADLLTLADRLSDPAPGGAMTDTNHQSVPEAAVGAGLRANGWDPSHATKRARVIATLREAYPHLLLAEREWLEVATEALRVLTETCEQYLEVALPRGATTDGLHELEDSLKASREALARLEER